MLPNDRIVRWYPALLLVVLVGLTQWLDQKVQQPPVPRDGSTRHDPDFVVEKFTAMRMNPDGSQRYAIRGERMTHYPDDNSTELARPRFVHFDPRTAQVRIDANEALVSRDGDLVHFKGDVHIVRDAYADQRAMSLETDYLQLVPDEDLATTDKPVTLRQGDTVVKSVGMRYDHGARILQLQSQVKVTYASPLNLSSLRRK